MYRICSKGANKDLTPDEQIELKRLLVNNADAFSTHDLDLGSFDAIEHTVDTGDAKPVKQRLRRTPVCFEGEEEKHLDKMLKAGVIEPSHFRMGLPTRPNSQKGWECEVVVSIIEGLTKLPKRKFSHCL